MSSAGNRDFDEILKEIAKALHKNEDIDNLGKALGFEPAEIGRKTDENAKQGGNYMGTLDLIRTWRNRRTPSTEQAALRSALLKFGYKNLADKYLTTSVTVKTTSFPSSPNAITSTSTATTTRTSVAASTPTATQKAFLVLTMLTAVTVSGTTQELSTTTGDTVNIPCLFGEGTLSSIFWSYSDGTGRHKILSLANGDLTIEPEYANRASLQKDNSTLILKDITVYDAGTYRCDVDRQGQTVVTNINTNLNVFSLRPDTLPVISPCTVADESSSCNIRANQSIALTCALPNVYPVKDTQLIWYKDRKQFSSIHDVTQNYDGTTDISRQIKIYETGNFTCNATYISATGRENTATSVEVWIIPPVACRPALDVPPSPGKNMTSGHIAGIITGIVLLVVISVAITTLFLYRSKFGGQRSSRNDELNQVISTEELALLETSAENGIEDEHVESSDSIPSSAVRRRNVNRTYPVTPSSLDILDSFIRSGLHPNGYRRVVWPKQMTVVCLIDYPDNSNDIVIKHNTPQLKQAEEILIEYINSELDITKIKRITIYSNYSSCTQCSDMLQILKEEIPDLQIKFSALYNIRRQSCTVSCGCYTADPESFTMLRKLDARPFQKEDWDDLINLLKKSDEQKGYPTSDLHVLRYGDHYRVWRNGEDEKMMADYAAMTRRNGEDENMIADYEMKSQ